MLADLERLFRWKGAGKDGRQGWDVANGQKNARVAKKGP